MDLSTLTSIAFGVISIIAYSFSIIFLIKILRNFKRNKNFALVRFYLDEKVIKGYKLLAFTSILFSVGMFMSVLVRVTEITVIKFITYILMLPLVFSFLYWSRIIADATSEKS
ncbi:MAG: hypothetical protein QW609_03130 [Candidatus Aenigmatarchaeota archaeon]